MKPLPHTYAAQLSGGPEGYAVVSVAGIRNSVPLHPLTSMAPAMHGVPNNC